jgi:hypothetical protein
MRNIDRRDPQVWNVAHLSLSIMTSSNAGRGSAWPAWRCGRSAAGAVWPAGRGPRSSAGAVRPAIAQINKIL